ncbi:MAG TPA: biopolymer transporter ExbD [Desulfobacterales bacterium]|nr:biopolymer transporter ExbD [Desulfobacterales bacterium]
MRFKRITIEEEPRLGMAPLIDVVFLLLIFFMLTSHFEIASGVRIRLPKVARKVYESEQAKVIVLIDKQGTIYLKGKKVDLGLLKDKISKLVNEKGIVNLVLQADKYSSHGRVVAVMDAAKKAGIRSIIIAAKWKPEEK